MSKHVWLASHVSVFLMALGNLEAKKLSNLSLVNWKVRGRNFALLYERFSPHNGFYWLISSDNFHIIPACGHRIVT